jgi:glutamate N-acetyltransferase/amino-acid N-acetyltransferase
MQDLALQIVRDGEGATKLVEVRVTGAKTARDADKVARSIANSPLVKTAIAGEDPNWGRIVMAVGKSGAVADRDLLTIRFGDVLVAEKGWVAEAIRGGWRGLHERARTHIAVDLGLGTGAATVWTCDLTSTATSRSTPIIGPDRGPQGECREDHPCLRRGADRRRGPHPSGATTRG